MRSTADVTREIRDFVQSRIDAGVIVRVEWLTTEILAAKSNIEGDDAEFYEACAVHFIKDRVKRVIGDYEPQARQTPEQLTLDGFQHMQKAYTVERRGETVLVPVDQLSFDEIEARACEYEAMAEGCVAHAQELRVYNRSRQAA